MVVFIDYSDRMIDYKIKQWDFNNKIYQKTVRVVFNNHGNVLKSLNCVFKTVNIRKVLQR
jgi:hypothetical protein